MKDRERRELKCRCRGKENVVCVQTATSGGGRGYKGVIWNCYALIFQGVPRAIYFKSTTFVSGLVSASGLGLLYLICLAGTPDMFGLQGAGLCWYDGQLLQLSLALLGWIDIL